MNMSILIRYPTCVQDFVSALYKNNLDNSPFELGVVVEMLSESAAMNVFNTEANVNQVTIVGYYVVTMWLLSGY